ncbi:MAG: ABC transporter ATP-binding protein [Spirochaetes bacterium]|nr:ABC transporter ATP-binding protein [Spirochaetota bacterium]
MITIKAFNLTKRYTHTLFKGITFELTQGQSLAIMGPNGSGKSTLLKIIGTIVLPDSGYVEYYNGHKRINSDVCRRHVGIVAPYIQCYNNLTAIENIMFAFGSVNDATVELLKRLDIYKHKDKVLHEYSTGMVQRCKIAMALAKKPDVVLLDEPGSNLDDAAKKILFEMIEEIKPFTVIIIATNDSREANLCHRSIVLDKSNFA